MKEGKPGRAFLFGWGMVYYIKIDLILFHVLFAYQSSMGSINYWLIAAFNEKMYGGPQ